MGDFEATVQWAIKSWVPFVSSLCPSDSYKIYKKGDQVRIDTTLVGFERLSWVRGDISLLVSLENEPRVVFVDHERRVVQQVYPNDFSLTVKQLEEEVSASLNGKLVSVLNQFISRLPRLKLTFLV